MLTGHLDAADLEKLAAVEVQPPDSESGSVPPDLDAEVSEG